MRMIDMGVSLDNDEDDSGIAQTVGGSSYPYNLCISLTDDQLERLDLDTSCEVGDYIHFEAMAKVTSVSQHESMGNRVELQIVAMACEDEDTENDEPEQSREPKYYGY